MKLGWWRHWRVKKKIERSRGSTKRELNSQVVFFYSERERDCVSANIRVRQRSVRKQERIKATQKKERAGKKKKEWGIFAVCATRQIERERGRKRRRRRAKRRVVVSNVARRRCTDIFFFFTKGLLNKV